MIKKVLIANRSEIACRIIRACKEAGILTVAVYSDVDKNALHVLQADESVRLGPAPASESYLNQDLVLKAALDSGCDSIHPGYGFLAENHGFNQKVIDAGLIFIGPNPESMRMLGSKTESRVAMINAGVPVAPGMKGGSKNISEFISEAEKSGYPVLIKAAAGGGGKGMRIVRSADEMEESVHSAMRESLSAFGSDEVFMEKYIESPRHVEIQIAADKHGNAVALFERECSIQRRHQKIIEEAPSTALTPELRKIMCDAAIDVVKAADYDSVGTVEFLLDKSGKYYFLEVNTRIQVEHPVTEMTTGIDLVKLQINIAAGEKMPFAQEDLKQTGHAIECRVYAEDADNNFMPSSGKILYLREPKGMGVRYDSGIMQGSDVTVFYDPVLAKLIVHGANREEARKRMIMALKENVVLGVKTSIAYMAEILEHPDFISGNTQTDFIEKHMAERKAVPEEYTQAAMVAAALLGDKNKPQAVCSGNGHSGSQSPWQTVGKWEIASCKI